MRSLPSLLRSLTGAAVFTGAYPERTRRDAAQDMRLVPGWENGLKHLDVERVEAIVRRYQGRPARIENPFAGFPTRSHWLRKMMHYPG